jgi:hypothetical protein
MRRVKRERQFALNDFGLAGKNRCASEKLDVHNAIGEDDRDAT